MWLRRRPRRHRGGMIGRFFKRSRASQFLPTSNVTLGRDYKLSLEMAALPASLLSLAIGVNYNQNMERVALPANLRSITFVANCNQSMEKAAVPASMQNLTIGETLEKVAISTLSLLSTLIFRMSPSRAPLSSTCQTLDVAPKSSTPQRTQASWSRRGAYDAAVAAA